VNGRRRMVTTIPFTPDTRHAFGRDSGLVFGSTGSYSLVKSGGHLDSTRIMTRAWTPDALPDSIRQAAVDRMVERSRNQRVDETTLRNSFPLAEVPVTAPAFTNIVQDEAGRTWAIRPRLSDSTMLDVFGTDGAWLGPVTVDLGGAGTLVFASGVMYSAGQTPDGLPAIKRWRLDTTDTR